MTVSVRPDTSSPYPPLSRSRPPGLKCPGLLSSYLNSIVLAPIHKIGRAAPRELLAQSFRRRSLTLAFGLVSVPELTIGAVIAQEIKIAYIAGNSNSLKRADLGAFVAQAQQDYLARRRCPTCLK